VSVTLRTAIPTLSALLLGFGLMQMGNTLQGTLLSLRATMEGFAPVQVGAVGASFWAGIVIGSLCGGGLIRRVGHIRTFAALGAIASTAPLLHLLVINPGAWVLARALTGFCFAGLFIVVESWLNGVATIETRGQILSVYGMTGLMAGIGGQLLLPATDPAGFAPFCLIAVILAYALVPIVLSRSTAPAMSDAAAARIDVLKLNRQAPFGVVAAFLSGATSSAFFSLGPLFAQQRGLDTGEIAIFMACGTLGGFLMAWPLGWLSDRLDRRLVIICAAAVAAAGLLVMMAIVPRGAYAWKLYLCVAVFGATVIPIYSIIIAHVNDAVVEEEFVVAAGGLLLVQGIGAVVGPLIAGLAMSASPRGLSYTLVVAQILIAVWGAYRLTKRSAPPDKRKGHFLVEPTIPVGTALASAHSAAE
jgi:MFS family permease